MPEPDLTWKQKRQLLKYFVPSLKDHPEWPVIISEGDSWFSFDVHYPVNALLFSGGGNDVVSRSARG